jgi:hypothetical protein
MYLVYDNNLSHHSWLDRSTKNGLQSLYDYQVGETIYSENHVV